jgi:hypothetical protein
MISKVKKPADLPQLSVLIATFRACAREYPSAEVVRGVAYSTRLAQLAIPGVQRDSEDDLE